MSVLILLAGLVAAAPQFTQQRAFAGELLQQVGVGTRRATIFKVEAYVGALYARANIRSEDALLADAEPKIFEVVLLRAVSKDTLADAFIEGIERSAAQPVRPAETAQFKAWVRDFARGDRLTIEYLPSKGTSLRATQIAEDFRASSEFGRALFSMWIGPKPVDEVMKRELLGPK